MVALRDGSQGAPDIESPAIVRVALVIASPMARAGLRAFLQAAGRFTLVGEASTCDELVPKLAEGVPQLVIADPGGGSLTSLGDVRSAVPGVRILVLAGDPSRIGEAARAGADGFLLDDADEDRILRAIDDLLAGRAVLDPELALDALRTAPEPVSDPEPLTPRELEILRLMSQGHTNPQIASLLFLAVGTVKVHVEHILGKLAAVDRTDAAVRALNQGLLDEDPG